MSLLLDHTSLVVHHQKCLGLGIPLAGTQTNITSQMPNPHLVITFASPCRGPGSHELPGPEPALPRRLVTHLPPADDLPEMAVGLDGCRGPKPRLPRPEVVAGGQPGGERRLPPAAEDRGS